MRYLYRLATFYLYHIITVYVRIYAVGWDRLERIVGERGQDSLGGGDSGVGSGDIAHSGRLRLLEKCDSESAISDRSALSRGGWVDKRRGKREKERLARYANRRVASARPVVPFVRFVSLLSRRHRVRNAGRGKAGRKEEKWRRRRRTEKGGE